MDGILISIGVDILVRLVTIGQIKAGNSRKKENELYRWCQ